MCCNLNIDMLVNEKLSNLNMSASESNKHSTSRSILIIRTHISEYLRSSNII